MPADKMNSEARNPSHSSRRTVSTSSRRPQSLEEVCAAGHSPPPLCVGDHVVWLSDNGPEFGHVRWLGRLPDVGADWMAGVEFVNPVGSGTGLYNDQQLFEVRMNHASLVPVIGLMKAEDFGGSPDGHAPPKPSRSRNSRRSSGKDPLPLPQMTSTSPTDVSLLQQHMSDLNMPSESGSLTRDSPPKSSPSPAQSPAFRFDNQVVTKLASDEADNHEEERNDKVSPLRSNGKSLTNNGSEELEVGSLVEVIMDGDARHGVIRWIGVLEKMPDDVTVSDLRDGSEEENRSRKLPAVLTAGIELEEECNGCCDGSVNGVRYFTCGSRKGYFVPVSECRKDSRFCAERRPCISFGSIDCPSVTGDVAPLSTPEELQALCGKNRGIQGHHNSCYLDATLFSMFSCTTIFESLLYRPPTKNDIVEYQEVQRVLKEEIVNPLRANYYVRADRVMHFRTLLERLTSVRGLTSEEKDPEEFLNLVLNQILKADPYLKLSSGLESFFYQLFVEKDDKLALPSVQQLFDQSFLASDIKLRQVPPALLIQMPRFGRQFKMYPRIIPSLYLDITDVLDNSPRQCCICGLLAEYECKQCFGQFGEGLDSTAFCAKCLDKSHAHKKRCKHQLTRLTVPDEFLLLREHTQVPRVYMELFAVLCIETSHYVSFVKCGSGPDAPWCFFDSMADRKGKSHPLFLPLLLTSFLSRADHQAVRRNRL